MMYASLKTRDQPFARLFILLNIDKCSAQYIYNLHVHHREVQGDNFDLLSQSNEDCRCINIGVVLQSSSNVAKSFICFPNILASIINSCVYNRLCSRMVSHLEAVRNCCLFLWVQFQPLLSSPQDTTFHTMALALYYRNNLWCEWLFATT